MEAEIFTAADGGSILTLTGVARELTLVYGDNVYYVAIEGEFRSAGVVSEVKGHLHLMNWIAGADWRSQGLIAGE